MVVVVVQRPGLAVWVRHATQSGVTCVRWVYREDCGGSCDTAPPAPYSHSTVVVYSSLFIVPEPELSVAMAAASAS